MKRLFVCLSLIATTLTSCADNRDYMEIYIEKCEKFASLNEKEKYCDVDFLGDSITELCVLNKYYPDLKVANRGISGDTTDMLLTRMEVSAYQLEPKIVSLLIGTNNLDTCLNDYEEILKGLSINLPNTKVVVSSIIPRRGKDLCEQIKSNNVAINQLADKYNYTYVDLYSHYIKNNKVNELLFKDGLHPNKKGYQVMKDVLMPIFVSLLS